MNEIKVVFRKDKKTNEILAFIPESEVRRGNIMGYAHEGQHFEADYLYYKETIKASEDEYQNLYNELNKTYDNKLVIKQKVHHNDLLKSWR